MRNNIPAPDWSTAPEWANWFAIDDEGFGFFFQNKPEFLTESGVWMPDSGLVRKVPGHFDTKCFFVDLSLQVRRPAPDWSRAPEWAKWFAIDDTGGGFFYEEKPELNFIKSGFVIPLYCSQKWDFAGIFPSDNFTDSLQERPSTIKSTDNEKNNR